MPEYNIPLFVREMLAEMRRAEKSARAVPRGMARTRALERRAGMEYLFRAMAESLLRLPGRPATLEEAMEALDPIAAKAPPPAATTRMLEAPPMRLRLNLTQKTIYVLLMRDQIAATELRELIGASKSGAGAVLRGLEDDGVALAATSMIRLADRALAEDRISDRMDELEAWYNGA